MKLPSFACTGSLCWLHSCPFKHSVLLKANVYVIESQSSHGCFKGHSHRCEFLQESQMPHQQAFVIYEPAFSGAVSQVEQRHLFACAGMRRWGEPAGIAATLLAPAQTSWAQQQLYCLCAKPAGPNFAPEFCGNPQGLLMPQDMRTLQQRHLLSVSHIWHLAQLPRSSLSPVACLIVLSSLVISHAEF